MKKRGFLSLLIVCCATCLLVAGTGRPQAKTARFSRTTIDIGVVVSDVEKAARFYTEALGFTELPGFDVSAELAGDTGLTDRRPFKVRVFVLGEGPTATKLKIMTIPGAGSKKVATEYISSSLGYSYLTVYVADLTEALARLRKNNIAPVAAPYQLGNVNNYLVLVKDPDGNIVELIGPMQ